MGGGAIHADSSALTLRGCVVSDNHDVGNNGGAIEMAGNPSSLTLDTCTFSGNSAAGNGGAIDSPGLTLAISDSVLDQEQIPSVTPGFFSGGGALSIGGGTVTITGSSFTGNTSTAVGGAINSNFGATFDVRDSVFADNTSEGDGGAIDNHSSGVFSLSNSTLSGNADTGDQTSGGAIFNSGTLELLWQHDRRQFRRSSLLHFRQRRGHRQLRRTECHRIGHRSPAIASLDLGGGVMNTAGSATFLNTIPIAGNRDDNDNRNNFDVRPRRVRRPHRGAGSATTTNSIIAQNIDQRAE